MKKVEKWRRERIPRRGQTDYRNSSESFKFFRNGRLLPFSRIDDVLRLRAVKLRRLSAIRFSGLIFPISGFSAVQIYVYRYGEGHQIPRYANM